MPGMDGLVDKLLKRHDVDVNARDDRGRTALMLAVAKPACIDAVRALLDDPSVDTTTAAPDAGEKDSTSLDVDLVYIAALHDNVEALQALLDYGLAVNPDVLVDDEAGELPFLEWVAYHGNARALDMLLDESEDSIAKEPERYNKMLLHVAGAAGHRAEVVRVLIVTAGADPNNEDEHGYTPLAKAVRAGNAGIVSTLVDHGVQLDVHKRYTGGQTLLHLACAAKGAEPAGVETVLHVLLDAGADPAACADDGRWPLMRAVTDLNYQAAAVLLQRTNVDVNAQDEQGRTVLHVALQAIIRPDHTTGEKQDTSSDADNQRKHELVTSLLQQPGVKVGLRNHDADSALDLAMKNDLLRDVVITLLLISTPEDRSWQDAAGWTLLHYAADRGDTKALKLLLALGGMDVNARDPFFRKTPLASACYRGCTASALLLLGHPDVDLSLQDPDGQTAFNHACVRKLDKVVEAMLASGRCTPAVLNQRTVFGRTPFIEVCQSGDLSLFGILIEQPALDTAALMLGRTGLQWACMSATDLACEMAAHPAILPLPAPASENERQQREEQLASALVNRYATSHDLAVFRKLAAARPTTMNQLMMIPGIDELLHRADELLQDLDALGRKLGLIAPAGAGL